MAAYKATGKSYSAQRNFRMAWAKETIGAMTCNIVQGDGGICQWRWGRRRVVRSQGLMGIGCRAQLQVHCGLQVGCEG
eukprot:7418010-Alexandrium_andersonii.AAC.1